MRVTARGRTPTGPDAVFPTLAVGDIVRTPKGALGIVRRIYTASPEGRAHSVCLCYPEDDRGDQEGLWKAEDGLLLVVQFQSIKRICGIRAGVQKS